MKVYTFPLINAGFVYGRKAAVQWLKMCRLYWPFGGQVRSYSIRSHRDIVGADLSANAVALALHLHRMYRPLPGQPERRPISDE